ncbi:homogentisate 1,2-dioxygenase [Variovorax terrae]|uniref:Homogentisate 1,2-dioxygenase n=1 Tax=Variovorax terrae TaxID=2923278 RepID=A0A9X1VZK7_9BURK|nr:homogentisate 1,2-dioxygenase [Variovorax terrae]MCJ0766183.1 homogentisate 1,2-dioxygenase [Variovorax terrae]
MNQTIQDGGSARQYLRGFGNQFESEAIAGALPVSMNSPQHVPYGLYAEQLSGTAFTSVRAEGRRTWTYRMLPSASDAPYEPAQAGGWLTAPMQEGAFDFRPMRWRPLSCDGDTDFRAGLLTIGANGNAAEQVGCAIHVYAASRSMTDEALCNCDGELLIVPQEGGIEVQTELGWLAVRPGEIVVIPRGLCFRVELTGALARGYVLENYGPALRLPELGPIGANGLANPRDFHCPVAAFDNIGKSYAVIHKYCGQFWVRRLASSPFNVVSWHGNLVPFKYDLERFNAFGSVSYDSPDPSISTVLTSPSPQPGTAYVDFVVFPPRWQVAEGTFRPPYFHRNVMTEFMGLIYGEYEGKREGFRPGGFSLHSSMAPHGPDQATYVRGVEEPVVPNKLSGTMAFMFETKLPLMLNKAVLDLPELDGAYLECWRGFHPARAAAEGRGHQQRL